MTACVARVHMDGSGSGRHCDDRLVRLLARIDRDCRMFTLRAPTIYCCFQEHGKIIAQPGNLTSALTREISRLSTCFSFRKWRRSPDHGGTRIEEPGESVLRA